MIRQGYSKGVFFMQTETSSFCCRNCGQIVNISPEKQGFLAEKGYEGRLLFCDACINARLDQIWEAPGERRVAICSDCGCETRLNFVPCKELPVYCPQCFKKRNSNS